MKYNRHVVEHAPLDDVINPEITRVLNVALDDHQLAVEVSLLGADCDEQLSQTDRRTDGHVAVTITRASVSTVTTASIIISDRTTTHVVTARQLDLSVVGSVAT